MTPIARAKFLSLDALSDVPFFCVNTTFLGYFGTSHDEMGPEPVPTRFVGLLSRANTCKVSVVFNQTGSSL